MIPVLMVASEAAPLAKVGGLADVVGALSAALRELGHEVAVVMPRYRGIALDGAQRVYGNLDLWFGPACYRVNVYLREERARYLLVDCPELYDRPGIYGPPGRDYEDNHVRYAVLARAAFALARHVFRPRIFHCHDWQASLVPIYLRTILRYEPTFIAARTVLTIHNLGYQGIYPPSALPEMGLNEQAASEAGMEFFGRYNLLKGAISSSDRITVVSPTYAREIQTPELGFGLDDLLRQRSHAITGILNGADYSEWNPETDPYIAAHYSRDDLSGKAACKRDLLDEFGLPAQPERPLIGMVSRLDSQKGFDLLREAAGELIAEDLTLVVLGTGNQEYEGFLRELVAARPDRVGLRIGFDIRLAHKIVAGADIFLMPSRYEPCGLNQLYSLRYGTVPVVRSTGGLEDTVDESTGFKFREYSAWAMMEAVRAALAAWRDRPRWEALMRAGMAKDFSWKISAARYSELFRELAA
ncbi:MAG: glycogen synthase GlgA [Bryobacterales bacterium]|nr:glycogen synthase GlgA [Bryobacteraceae bacterium]MDW8129196.1 glycogen synthase GlgA [Bryobacterales bacterium]